MSLFNINYHKIASINIFSYQEYDVFVKAISWIINGKLDLAYRLCCRFNAELQGNPGLGCDWTTRWHNGIPSHLETICINTMNTTNSSLVAAGAIYLQFSGVSSRKVAIFAKRLYDEHIVTEKISLEQIRYIDSQISCERHFDSYKKSGIRSYIFSAVLDNSTCPICGNLDGHSFSVSERKIGINCPPMHIGCRCTTISSPIMSNATRCIWNPITHKSEIVPYINYAEWCQKYK